MNWLSQNTANDCESQNLNKPESKPVVTIFIYRIFTNSVAYKYYLYTKQQCGDF
jgi:hypothetical protein